MISRMLKMSASGVLASLGPSLAAALPDSHFEHPAEASTVVVPVGDLRGY
jgi:hypothetical protein